MKVLNLQCQHQHPFEGWFASEDDYQSQRASNLVECPVCGDNTIHKMPSAPRLNLLTSRIDAPASKETALTETTSSPDLPVSVGSDEAQVAWLKMVQHVIANTEDVGQGFAEEARKMHYGEAKTRNIRGHATPEETEELMDEGIAVMPLPLPDALKEPLQ